MLGWLFKKNETPASPKSVATKNVPGKATPPKAATAPKPAPAPAAPTVEWAPRLQAALGNDEALLALARERAPVETKLAAVEALAGEASLKLAEREFRDHDRRVHRLAKQRHALLVARRETREQAARLVEAARALRGEPLIPTNRLVALDRDWQALDASHLEAGPAAEFGDLLAQLSAITRERGDQALKLERWNADAKQAQEALRAALAEAAEGALDRSPLQAAASAAQSVLDAVPEGVDAGPLRDTLAHAAPLEQQLAALDAVLQGAPAEHWQQLTPLSDGVLRATLARRFEQWRNAQAEARQAQRSEQREEAKGQRRANAQEQSAALSAALDQAEATLAGGHLSDTNRHLVEIDELLHGQAAPAALRTRLDALQAEYARLKGWQHWAGGVARDELVLQAEALATATGGEAEARTIKLSPKQQSEVIDELRARWKELDRLGGATSRALWQRFDGALQTAYLPVAAHLAAQRAVREQNLQSRRQLVEALNAVPLPEGTAPDAKALAGALDGFQTEWRKLGPLEHTVPRKALDRLVEQMNAAVERIEVPLRDARRSAQREREQFIARAKALGADAAGGQGRDTVARVRELQAEWQQHAKALPLARAAENALWAEFKAAIDALFSAREAQFNARDAEFKAHGAERTALIERLEALGDDTPANELKRALTEVETQWQRSGPAPRQEAATLDARFRAAHDAAAQRLATHAQRGWQATCDALLAKLALCEALERHADKAEVDAQWATLAALPSAWEQALVQRVARAASGAADPAMPGADELLLQLEAAWQVESPAAFEAARRDLKLLALKSALEGGRAAAPAPTPDQLLGAALGRASLDAAQRERLASVLAALRRRPSPPARR
jgi:hypothetical protein